MKRFGSAALVIAAASTILGCGREPRGGVSESAGGRIGAEGVAGVAAIDGRGTATVDTTRVDTVAGVDTTLRVAVQPPQPAPYQFEALPARASFSGEPAPPDLSSDRAARDFATAIADGAHAGPNFAGHYTVVQWSCGEACRHFVIVDALSGRIAEGFDTHRGVKYQLDSELLVADPLAPGEVPAAGAPAHPAYFRWTGDRLVRLPDRPVAAR